MPPVSERPATPGRRAWSRIASPFAASKSRHIAEFSVRPDDEHRQYSSGDIVSGHVRLRVAKAIRVTHVVVCLHGFVQVYKNPGSPVEAPRSGVGGGVAGRGKKVGEGYASLFEDEVVLCGEGRLAEGIYQFNFELGFPERSLPSSIDFERGAISYMITATLTRPNSMSPPVSCDRSLAFVESIDISPLYPPKARTITLEPLSKRSRAKPPSRKQTDLSDKSSNSNGIQTGSDTPRQSVSSAPSIHTDIRSTMSPSPSEASLESRPNNGAQLSQLETDSRRSSTPSDSGKVPSSKASLMNKVISVTIESQAGGCLQGDYIPIKVDISHTKHVRSLYGVIVTLFRQARVEMRPLVPLGPTEKGKDSKSEDFYPRSITGLGGLSLSGAGSSHIFRKDLCQVVRPLYIDPQGLATEVKARVRVPDEAFPTISSVPGSMISFKYYVEVVVDIQGKLSGLDKAQPNYPGQTAPTNQFGAEDLNVERTAATSFGSTIIDTAAVRRDKGVVTCTFEVIVGTKDSERRKGKRKMVDATIEPVPPEQQAFDAQHYRDVEAESGMHYYGPYDGMQYAGYGEPYAYQDLYPSYYEGMSPSSGYEESNHDLPPPAIPLPPMPDESQMSEKERIQQAETRLLPSQPPGMENNGDVDAATATAPYLPDDSTSLPVVAGASSTASASAPPLSQDTANHLDMPPPSNSTLAYVPDLDTPSESTPAYAPATCAAGPSAHTASAYVDDKRELQRTELEAAASEPPPITNGDEQPVEPVSTAAPVTTPEPSAPTLAEIDASIHDSHSDATASSELPRYER